MTKFVGVANEVDSLHSFAGEVEREHLHQSFHVVHHRADKAVYSCEAIFCALRPASANADEEAADVICGEDRPAGRLDASAAIDVEHGIFGQQIEQVANLAVGARSKELLYQLLRPRGRHGACGRRPAERRFGATEDLPAIRLARVNDGGDVAIGVLEYLARRKTARSSCERVSSMYMKAIVSESAMASEPLGGVVAASTSGSGSQTP